MAKDAPLEQTQPGGWLTLRCDCGNELFQPTIKLRWKEGGGTTEQPFGYQCTACQGVVNAAKLIDRAQLDVQRAKLRELEIDIAQRGG